MGLSQIGQLTLERIPIDLTVRQFFPYGLALEYLLGYLAASRIDPGLNVLVVELVIGPGVLNES